MKTVKNLLILFVLLPSLGYAQDLAPGLRFLKLGVGARACGMGEAFTGIANDGSASYWNPAGLGYIESPEILVMHSEWFVGTRFEYISGTIPSNIGVFGLSFTYLTSGKIEGRNEFGELTNTYENSDLGVNIAHGRRIGKNLLIGLGFKAIYERIEKNTGTGIAIDIGSLYRLPFGLNIGLVAQNLGSGIKVGTENTELPTTFRAGCSYKSLTSIGELTPAADLVVDINGNTLENLGLEFVILKILALRLGYRIGLQQECITSGMGLNHNIGTLNLRFDYAYTGFSDLGTTHKLSLCLTL